MKKILLIILPVILLACLSMFWWNSVIKPVSTDNQTVDFLITKGSSAQLIANRLEEAKLIRSSLAFRFYVKVTGIAKKIQAGEYSLSPSYSLYKLTDLLTKGPSELWVTIPEGTRREETAVKFATTLGKKDKDTFYKEFISASSGKEGYLFPDTYLFPKTASATAIVKKMLQVFNSKTESQNLTITSETVIFASIVERETLTDAERPVVAGILAKRLKNRWPLQADATIQYLTGSARCSKDVFNCKWWEPPTKADLEIKSPYNTYRSAALPPYPICNPGLASLKAAAEPTQSEFWFYLHDAKGVIHYARTIEEHNANITKYLR